MDNETEMIKHQMEETREDLSKKLEALEQHVLTTVQDTTDSVASTVESVKDAVTGTVSSVKETVSETVDTVKDAFDISGMVERHPCASFFGAIALGYIGTKLLMPRGEFLPPSRGEPMDARWPDAPRFAASAPPAAKAEPGFLAKMTERFEPALDKLKDLALEAGTGLVGKMILDSVGPAMKDQVAAVIDEVASGLGTKPPHLAAQQQPFEETPPASKQRQDIPQDRVRSARGNGRHV